MKDLSDLKIWEPADGSGAPGHHGKHEKADVRRDAKDGLVENYCACVHCLNAFPRAAIDRLLEIYFFQRNQDERLFFDDHLFHDDHAHFFYDDHLCQ